MPGGPVLTLENAGKIFTNGVKAIERLDLEVRSGEFLSLLGPSGCGKSTALRLMAFLNEPSYGLVRRWPDAGAAKKDIGFVFQEPTLMPWTTVAENVALPLKLGRSDPAQTEARTAKALESVGMSAFAGAYPRELSGGMKMRVSIARALVTQPRLLLMDEPFAALDEITRFKLNDDLTSITHALEMTVVFVTHSVFESVFLSHRVVIMTPRPARIFAEIAIDAPHPRTESFRTSPEYAAYCRSVSNALSAAIGEAGP